VTMGVACFSLLLAWVSPISMLSATTVKATSNDPDRATKRAPIMLPISDSISRLCDTGDHLNRLGLQQQALLLQPADELGPADGDGVVAAERGRW
jgi:hypothetical protein